MSHPRHKKKPTETTAQPVTNSAQQNIKKLLEQRKTLLDNIKKCENSLSTTTLLIQIRLQSHIEKDKMALNNVLKELNIRPQQEWMLDIVDQSKLPYLGLPAEWDKTSKAHSLIAFDPATNKSINLKNNEEKINKSSPIGFIYSTAGQNPIHGTKMPAAARYTRFQETVGKNGVVTDARGEAYAICPTHGDFVKVESLQADHMQPRDDILKKQLQLVEDLNNNPKLAETIMQCEGIEKFFVKVGKKYFGTVLFYELYYNDIENIWLICQACNLHKSNLDSLTYLENQWLYGKEFKKYIKEVGLTVDGILTKTKEGKVEGLAELAIRWFWKRHAAYIATETIIFSEILKPLQMFNQKVDKLEGSGNLKRAERNKSSLDITLRLTKTAANTYIRFSRGSGEDTGSSKNTSDEEKAIILTDKNKKKLKLSAAEKLSLQKEIESKLPSTFENFILGVAQEIVAKRPNTLKK